MAQTGGRNSLYGMRGLRVVNHAPPKRVPPQSSPVFGKLGNAAAPIVHAQRQAHQRVQRAQAPILKRTSVPYVPKLAHPTPTQRSAAVQIVGRGLKKQGVTTPEVKALARGQGSRTQQQRVNRYLGGYQTQVRKTQASVGRAFTLPPVQRIGPPRPQAPFTALDVLAPQGAYRPRLIPNPDVAAAQYGRQMGGQFTAQAKPYERPHVHGGIGPATIDLTSASNALGINLATATNAIGSKLAGNPISAFSKGLSQIAQAHAFSDKGVLGRTANDLLTYPAAAIPTAYEATVHPGKLVSGIVQQLEHPVQLTEQHPLFAAMALHGGVSALGRTSGAIARSGVLGSAVKEAAGTSRNMIGLAGESGSRIYAPRSYSKDVFRKAAQVAYDRRLKPIRDAKGDVIKTRRGRPVMAAPEGSRVYSPKRLQQQRATFITSRANARERHARTVASRFVHANQPVRDRRAVKLGTIPSRAPVPHALRGQVIDTAMVGRAVDRSLASQPATKVRVLGKRFYRPEKDVVAMAMEGTLRSPETFHADLLKERQRLETAYKSQELDPLQKRTNRIRARTIDRVLNDKRAILNARGVFASAKQLAAHGNELANKLVEAKLLDPAASARAKLFPYALSHMGARYGSDPYTQAHENVKAAKQQVRQLDNRLRNIKLVEQRHLGRTHDVLTAQRNRAILRQDQAVADATRARSAAQKELTLANRKVRNEQRSGGVTPAAHQRVTAARAQLQAAKGAHQQAVSSFEQRVAQAHGKAQRGEKLSKAEKQVRNFDRQPPGRLKSLESVRADRIAAEKELHAAKGRLSQAKARRAQTPKQALLSSEGKLLSNEEIHAHMRASGVNPEDIAYLPHRNDVRGARAYHQQFNLSRPNLDRQSRTGAAYLKGATDSGFSLPLEHIVHATTTLAKTREFDKLVQDVGIKHPSGRYFTWKQAEEYAARGGRAPNEATDKPLPGEPKLVPVRAYAAKYDEARAQAIENAQDPSVPGASDRLVRDQTARFDGPDPADPGAKNVVLIPEHVAERIKENLKPSTSFDKRLQGATSAFRTTVLPFSTKWLTGNVVEAVLRSGVAGVSPHDPLIGRKVVREMFKQDPEEAAAVLSHLVNGLMFGEKGLTNYVTGQQVAGDVGGMIAHSLPGRGIGKTVKGVTSPIFAFNKGLEQTALYGALGKYARMQMQEMTGSWFKALRAQDAALKDFAKGLKDTENQQAAAKYLDETLGQYSRFSPGMRRAIQGYAPFLPWYLNSARFVLHTLPFKHPVKTAVLTQAEAAFQKDWEAQHPGNAGKGSLKTAIPSHGGFIDASRYTPFGFPGPLAAGEYSSLSGVVLPQLSGLQLGLLGVDPFGQPLKGPKTASNPTGAPNVPLYALNQLLESYIPGLGLARRFREGGRKSLAGSTVFSPQTSAPKAGQPIVSAPNRIFNPFRPVYVSSSRAGGKSDPLAAKYGLTKGSTVDDLAKKYGVNKGPSVDSLAAKYGIK